jgi:hypothetical protein
MKSSSTATECPPAIDSGDARLLTRTGNSNKRVAEAEPESAPQRAVEGHCLWCGRVFSPRATGGSAQSFARPDTGRRLGRGAPLDDARGPRRLDCLKANQRSVYAVRGVFQSREEALPARSSD